VITPEPLISIRSAAVVSFGALIVPDPDTARPVMSFIVSVYVIGLLVTILVLGFFPRMRVSPSTLLVSSGKRLSSARDSQGLGTCLVDAQLADSGELDAGKAAHLPRLGCELAGTGGSPAGRHHGSHC
jgi:hypothetical protein